MDVIKIKFGFVLIIIIKQRCWIRWVKSHNKIFVVTLLNLKYQLITLTICGTRTKPKIIDRLSTWVVLTNKCLSSLERWTSKSKSNYYKSWNPNYTMTSSKIRLLRTPQITISITAKVYFQVFLTIGLKANSIHTRF